MTLLGYQHRWIEDPSPVRIIRKSRRIGMTFAAACESVILASAEDGTDVWYIGYNESMGQEFIRACERWARIFAEVAEMGGYKIVDSDAYLSAEIRFKSGHKIKALSSSARNLRGKSGHIIIDEAAFHPDLDGLLKAALAFTMWGGRVSIISTYFGSQNAFAKLCDAVMKKEADYSLHTVTIDDALSDGLYETICYANGVEATVEGRNNWREELFRTYGDYADEELLCIPDKGGASYFPRDILVRSSCEAEVLRIDMEDDVVSMSDDRVVSFVNKIIGEQVIFHGNPKCQYTIGVDFGRVSDISCIAVCEVEKNLKRKIPFVCEIHNGPFKAQEALILALAKRIGNVVGISIDGTGNGSYLGERFIQLYGPTIAESQNITQRWYGENFPPLKAAIEQQQIQIPRDLEIIGDLLCVTIIDGVPRIPREKNMSEIASTGRTRTRHGDSAIAIALAFSSSVKTCGIYDASKILTAPRRDGTHQQKRRGWFS